MRRLATFLLLLAATASLAGCAGGRAGDNDNSKPVFYGGITGGPFAR